MPLSVDIPMKAPMKIPTSEPTAASTNESRSKQGGAKIYYHLLKNCTPS
jgi:hypothetical protein